MVPLSWENTGRNVEYIMSKILFLSYRLRLYICEFQGNMKLHIDEIQLKKMLSHYKCHSLQQETTIITIRLQKIL